MSRVILAQNYFLTPFDLRTQIFRVNVEFSVNYPREKFRLDCMRISRKLSFYGYRMFGNRVFWRIWKRLSVDDETPRVQINHGLKMSYDQPTARIGSDVLAVTDLDSVDKELILVITYAPQRGQLRYDDGSPTGTYLSVGDFFTMDDLFYNRIIYERNAGKFTL